MAGPASQDVAYVHKADYKGLQALKSCLSEFRHFPLMWTYKGLGCNRIQALFLYPIFGVNLGSRGKRIKFAYYCKTL